MFVGGVVVGDEMDVEALRRLAVDLLQEAQPFDVRVALLGSGDQSAFEIIEGRKQRGRSMTLVVVRHRARMSRAKRQAGL